jgi:hypothetical protein
VFYGKKMNVIKANHHGSKFSNFGKVNLSPVDSNESPFLKILDPDVIVIPCNNRIPLPDKEFFLRIEKELKLSQIYLVNDFERGAEDKALKYLDLGIESIKKIKNLFKREQEYILFKKKYKHQFFLNYDKDNPLIEKKEKIDEEGEIEEIVEVFDLLPVIKILKQDTGTKYSIEKDEVAYIRGKKGESSKSFKKIPQNIYYQLISDNIPDKHKYYNSSYVDTTYLGHIWELIGLGRDQIPDVMDSFKKGSANWDDYHIKYDDEYDLESMLALNNILRDLKVNPNEFKKKDKSTDFNTFFNGLWDYLKLLKNNQNQAIENKRKRNEKKEKDLIDDEENEEEFNNGDDDENLKRENNSKKKK